MPKFHVATDQSAYRARVYEVDAPTAEEAEKLVRTAIKARTAEDLNCVSDDISADDESTEEVQGAEEVKETADLQVAAEEGGEDAGG